jgi:hypothetical protein
VVNLNHVELSGWKIGGQISRSVDSDRTDSAERREGRVNPCALDFCERESDEIIEDRRQVKLGRRRVKLGRETDSVEGEVLETCENAAM